MYETQLRDLNRAKEDLVCMGDEVSDYYMKLHKEAQTYMRGKQDEMY
jgi:hypothetical protein